MTSTRKSRFDTGAHAAAARTRPTATAGPRRKDLTATTAAATAVAPPRIARGAAAATSVGSAWNE